MLKKTFICLLLVGSGVSLWAVPPLRGRPRPDRTVCHVNTQEYQRHAQAMAFSGGRRGALPADLAPKVLVIRVRFPDEELTTSLSAAQAFFSDVRNYYSEVSYGVFQPEFTLTTSVYALSRTMGTYSRNLLALSNCSDDIFKSDVLSLANPAENFAPYRHVMIYHAGSGQETSGDPDDLWSFFLNCPFTADGRSFDGYTVVPEREAYGSPLGAICHEYGHQIGLPDLYDTSHASGTTQVGPYDLMDYPYLPFSNPGANPPHFGAWSKIFLGFTEAQPLADSFSLPPVETQAHSVGLLETGVPGEQFFFEYRLTSSGAIFDRYLPMSGLAVWHVDNTIANPASGAWENNVVNVESLNGSNPQHDGVDLVEADGTKINPLNPYESGDLFGGVITTVSPTQTVRFDGTSTGYTLSNLQPGPSGVTGIRTGLSAASQPSLVQAVNFPNPGGDPIRYPLRSGAPADAVTTFAVVCTAPLNRGDLTFDIVTPQGEKVRGLSTNDFVLAAGAAQPSADFRWVYEHDWNGKNDDGSKVSSGVYYYRALVKGQSAKGAMMLVR